MFSFSYNGIAVKPNSWSTCKVQINMKKQPAVKLIWSAPPPNPPCPPPSPTVNRPPLSRMTCPSHPGTGLWLTLPVIFEKFLHFIILNSKIVLQFFDCLDLKIKQSSSKRRQFFIVYSHLQIVFSLDL